MLDAFLLEVLKILSCFNLTATRSCCLLIKSYCGALVVFQLLICVNQKVSSLFKCFNWKEKLLTVVLYHWDNGLICTN